MFMIAVVLSVILLGATTGLAMALQKSLKREATLKTTLIALATAVENTYNGMREVDAKGWFANEDSTGFVFDDLFELLTLLRSIIIVEDGVEERDDPDAEQDNET